MKKFYIASLSLILLTGCKYRSAVEAFRACEEWKDEQLSMRLCKPDFGDQNRYIGLQWNGEGKPNYNDSTYWSRRKYKIIKRYNY